MCENKQTSKIEYQNSPHTMAKNPRSTSERTVARNSRNIVLDINQGCNRIVQYSFVPDNIWQIVDNWFPTEYQYLVFGRELNRLGYNYWFKFC